MITVKLSIISDSAPEKVTEITIADTPDQAKSMTVIATHVVVFWAAMLGDDPEVLKTMTASLNNSVNRIAEAVAANPIPK